MAKGKVKESRILGGWKKKQWFKIVAPKNFGEKEIGETPAFSPEKIVGRRMSVNLMTLTGNIKKQNMNLNLEINKVVGNKAYTFVRSSELLPAYIKRAVRRDRNRLDETVKCLDANNNKVIIKLILISSNLAKGSQLHSLREETKRFVLENVKAKSFADLISDFVGNRFQKTLSMNLKKIVPMKLIEIKKAELVKEKKAFGKKEEKKKAVFAEGEEGSQESVEEPKQSDKQEGDEKQAEPEEESSNKAQAKESPKTAEKESEKDKSKKIRE